MAFRCDIYGRAFGRPWLDKILTGLQLFLDTLTPFLKSGVMFVSSNTDENSDFSTDTRKLEHYYLDISYLHPNLDFPSIFFPSVL